GPATLLGRPDDGTHGRDVGGIQHLAMTRVVAVRRGSRRRWRWWRAYHGRRMPLYTTSRRNPVVEAVRAEGRILARTQDDAAAAKIGVLAYLPLSALDDRG